MKILFISMPSIHFFRWINNLEKTEHDLYWFDVLDRGEIDVNVDVKQITNWGKRKIPYIKGEYFLYKKFPIMYKKIERFLKRTASEEFSKIIAKIQPDIVHSFEMQSCTYPIVDTMLQNRHIKWIYSSWGSDLYFYKRDTHHLKIIKKVIANIDCLHIDNNRDLEISKSLGYRKKSIKIPGGGGFALKEITKLKENNRKIILIKGYESKYGRAINIIKALQLIDISSNYQIVIFGAHQKVLTHLETLNKEYKVFGRHDLSHREVLEFMGKSLIYCGNSISDGIPNTLLEAICAGAFPIQSNPGRVSEEYITSGENGFLINDPNDINEISVHIKNALTRPDLLKRAEVINQEIARHKLSYHKNNVAINSLYDDFLFNDLIKYEGV